MDLPDPIAICLEDLDTGGFDQCVAIAGGRPGLAVGTGGGLLWKSQEGVGAEIWVTADDRLALRRPVGAPPCVVRRNGRQVVAPEAKPVILLAGDELLVGDRALRLHVHVHGVAPAVHPPRPLERERGAGMRLATAAMALGLAGCVIIRPHPPAPVVDPLPDGSLEAEARREATVVFEVVDEQGRAMPTATLMVEGRAEPLDLSAGKVSLSELDEGYLEKGEEITISAWAPGYLPYRAVYTLKRSTQELQIRLVPEPIEVREAPPVVMPEDWEGH